MYIRDRGGGRRGNCVLRIGVSSMYAYVVYYESIKRELQRTLIYEYRCDERLKTKNEESVEMYTCSNTVLGRKKK